MYQAEIERITEELYFIAASPATRLLRTQAELLSQTDVPVLITGEEGSGEDDHCPADPFAFIRSSSPFMRVDYKVLTSYLLENELFGYEHTSANGRSESTPGKFEQCGKGTILLDHFDAMPGTVQRRLLKLLEKTREFVRCGRPEPDPGPCTYHRGHVLRPGVGGRAEKRVQEELFYRLSVFE